MLGVIFALKHFKVYVYGAPITLITDHNNLVKWLQKTHELPGDRQERWKEYVRNFDVQVVYRPGKENKAADALSRYPVPPNQSSVSRISLSPSQTTEKLSEFDSKWLSKVRESQRTDPWVKRVVDFKVDNVIPSDQKLARWLVSMDPRFHMIEDILFYVDSEDDVKLRVVVPESEKDQLLWDLHYSPLGGHLGMDKVLQKVRSRYYWPHLRQDVRTYLRSCIVCASRSGQGRQYKPPLHPVPAPERPFDTVAMDIVKLTRTRDGMIYCLVTTDLLSKFVIVSPMADMTAETVVTVFLRDVLPFGAPVHVLTDQGTQFTSELMRVVCDSLQIKQLFTTTFHPQCDGQTERANQTLEAMLSKCSSVRGDDWDRVVPFVCHAYNSSVHASTKDSPFHVLFGREPRSPSSSVFAASTNYFTLENDDDFKTMLPFLIQTAWEAARQASEKAKERQKVQYDKTARVPPFALGDRVFVEAKELARSKLSRRFTGPWVISKLTDTNAVVEATSRKGKAVTRRFHLDKLTRAHPEIGDRVYTGSGRHPVKLPSVKSPVGSTAQKGEEEEETDKFLISDSPDTEPAELQNLLQPVQTPSGPSFAHRYPLRSRKLVVRRVVVSRRVPGRVLHPPGRSINRKFLAVTGPKSSLGSPAYDPLNNMQRSSSFHNQRLSQIFDLQARRLEDGGPLATIMSITSLEFATLVIDLRKVCQPPASGSGSSRLPPQLSSFLMDPQNYFIVTNRIRQSSALYNLTGDCLQAENVHRPLRHSIFVIDLSRIAEVDLEMGPLVDVGELISWTQGNNTPPWIERVIQFYRSMPRGLLAQAFWGELPGVVAENIATRTAWTMFSTIHLVLRVNQVPLPLQSLQHNLAWMYEIPMVRLNSVDLSFNASIAWGNSSQKAKEVASAWMKESNRLRWQTYCIWLDGWNLLRGPLVEFSNHLKGFHLHSREKQMCLLKFILTCGMKWRLLFDPRGDESGSTISRSRRPTNMPRVASTSQGSSSHAQARSRSSSSRATNRHQPY